MEDAGEDFLCLKKNSTRSRDPISASGVYEGLSVRGLRKPHDFCISLRTFDILAVCLFWMTVGYMVQLLSRSFVSANRCAKNEHNIRTGSGKKPFFVSRGMEFRQ